MKTINPHQYNPDSGLKLKIPPPVYMLLFGAIMWGVSTQFESILFIQEPWNKLGFIIMLLSFIPASGAFRQFAKFHTTPDPLHPDNASKLVTSGVYRYSRNPMYLGLFLLLIAWAVYLGSLLVILFPFLFIWVVTEFQVKPEEAVLLKKFGKEYEHYKQNVRRWL